MSRLPSAVPLAIAFAFAAPIRAQEVSDQGPVATDAAVPPGDAPARAGAPVSAGTSDSPAPPGPSERAAPGPDLVPASLAPTPGASFPGIRQGARVRAGQLDPSDLPEGYDSRFMIEEENDAFGVGHHPTDDFYTQGLRISSRWASRVPVATSGHELLGFAAGQDIYTPSNIGTTDLQALRHDRPYAGWLYGALLWDLLMDSAPASLRLGADGGDPGASAVHLELALGTTGPHSAAGAVQTSWHGFVRQLTGNPNAPPDPAGWSLYQTANALAAGVALAYQFDLLRAAAFLGEATAVTGSRLAVRISPRARIDAGTLFDAASVGLEVRAGLMAARRPPGVQIDLPVELYAFGRADGRYVAYDGFIEAPLLNGVTTLVGVAPFVADLDAGIVARLGGLELAWAQVWRTNELRAGPRGSRRIHDVGQLRVAFVY